MKAYQEYLKEKMQDSVYLIKFGEDWDKGLQDEQYIVIQTNQDLLKMDQEKAFKLIFGRNKEYQDVMYIKKVEMKRI
jgi:hypothetical protein